MEMKLLIAIVMMVITIHLTVAYEDEWQKHIAKHGKKLNFSSTQEHNHRKNQFKKTHDKIEAHNKIKGNNPLVHNQFSTMTDEEKSSQYGYVPAGAKPAAAHRTISLQETRALPASVDLRTDKCMSPIKNQNSCGSCWTFSATATLEFNNCVKTGTQTILSEQQLVDCTGSNGCNGGDYTVAWNYIVGNGGQDKSSAYSYTGSYGSTCKFTSANVGATISPKYAVTNLASGDVATAMALLANRTVLSVGIIGADSTAFQHYSKGTVFTGPCGTAGHAINIVGYGTTSAGVNYWLIRNSWDTTWGDSGYGMFQRGTNLCGIESGMATTTASTGDVVQPVVWTTATGGGFSSSNCGYAGSVSSYMTMSSPSLDYCGNKCAATSTCNYFTYAGTTCTFWTFSSTSTVKPVAYVDSTQKCGSVVKRPTFTWTTSGLMQTSTNCDLNGSFSGLTFSGSMSLTSCQNYCLNTYPNNCNFFTLSTTGTCSLKLGKKGAQPSVMYSSANSNCGYVSTRF